MLSSHFLKNLLALFLLLVSTELWAATYYVATNGNDPLGSGSQQSPWATIGYALGHLSSGDTLIVRPGTYTGKQNFISDRLNPFPGGTKGSYTLIKAETPFTVTIRNDGPGNYWDSLLGLGGNYIEVNGFIFDMVDTLYGSYVGNISGNYNKVRQSIFRREGVEDTYGGWVSVGGSYNLLEDVAGVGTARYGFHTGGPNATNGYNIFRRVVGRMDYSGSNQPKSVFVHYGNNATGDSNHMVFQNCIALDSQQPDLYGNPDGHKNGGLKINKEAANDIIQGSITLNDENEIYTLVVQGSNHTIIDTVLWGSHLGNYGSILPKGFVDQASGTTVVRLTTGENEGGGNNTSRSDIQYLVMPNDPTKATILKRIGRSGTLYGEPGWNEVTSEDLWPWPNEDIIKAVFARPNDPPPGYTPPTNNTVRGFTVALDQFGAPMTLTRYIWQYLGHKIPDFVYGGGTVGGGATSPPQTAPPSATKLTVP